MLDPSALGAKLKELNFNFYSGVPCSFLKGLINYAVSDANYIAAANEGDAVAICAGAYMGGQKSVVLMQNSGLSNAISPLTSLNAIFKIPVLGFVSLRGEEGISDEPQHELMGTITTKMLDVMGITWAFLSDDPDAAMRQLADADKVISANKTFFFVVKKGTFSDGGLNLKEKPATAKDKHIIDRMPVAEPAPSRMDVIEALNKLRTSDVAVVATTGFTGRELYQVEDLDSNFYMVGSMGCASTFALGLALAQPKRKIICIDGDGAALMRMGALPTIAYYGPSNLYHLLLDNRCYESTGAQPTVSPNVDWTGIAAASGYAVALHTGGLNSFSQSLSAWLAQPRLTFAALDIRAGSPKDLKRPSVKPPEVAQRFMRALASPELKSRAG
jgi:phosphonopyruvate decarboxylase